MSKEAMAYYQDLFERASKSEGWKKYLRQMQLESAYMPAGELADFVKTYTSQIREILTSLDVKVVR